MQLRFWCIAERHALLVSIHHFQTSRYCYTDQFKYRKNIRIFHLKNWHFSKKIFIYVVFIFRILFINRIVRENGTNFKMRIDLADSPYKLLMTGCAHRNKCYGQTRATWASSRRFQAKTPKNHNSNLYSFNTELLFL